jgi:hypothetical protein
MSELLKGAVQKAVRRLLDPLARLLLESGIGIGEFQALARAAYVRAARDSDPAAGRPNVSRIATLTGLRRIEVTRLLALADDAPPEPATGRHRADRVLSGWWTDPAFLDDAGQPRVLPLRGKRRSFATLVERYSGEPRVQTILDELLRARAARLTTDGDIEVLSRTFVTARWDTDEVTALGERVREQIDTLTWNLRNPTRPRYAQSVIAPRLHAREAPRLLRLVGEQADALLRSVDDAVRDPSVKAPASADAIRLVVSVHVHEEPVEGTARR